jgi:outer membrane protein, multidrug efflux system
MAIPSARPIRWTALDLGRVRARIRQADARAEASVAQYELTVLRALEETENALVELGRQQARRDYLGTSAEASEQAAWLAKQRFEEGAADFLTVLDAERTLLEAQDRHRHCLGRTLQGPGRRMGDRG